MILAVDDDRLNLLLLAELLAENGYSILQADSMVGALELENDPRIKLLLFDSNLAPGTGSELLAIVRAREVKRGGNRRPAIVVTGDTDATTQKKLLADGFDQFIAKPYKADSLAEAIRTLLAG